jgi:hypothetical protein
MSADERAKYLAERAANKVWVETGRLGAYGTRYHSIYRKMLGEPSLFASLPLKQ